MLCRRTTDMMAANVPAPKMRARAIFSRRGLLKPFKVLIGSAMIQKSVMMFTPDVAIRESVLIHAHAGYGAIDADIQ